MRSNRFLLTLVFSLLIIAPCARTCFAQELPLSGNLITPVPLNPTKARQSLASSLSISSAVLAIDDKHPLALQLPNQEFHYSIYKTKRDFLSSNVPGVIDKFPANIVTPSSLEDIYHAIIDANTELDEVYDHYPPPELLGLRLQGNAVGRYAAYSVGFTYCSSINNFDVSFQPLFGSLEGYGIGLRIIPEKSRGDIPQAHLQIARYLGALSQYRQQLKDLAIRSQDALSDLKSGKPLDANLSAKHLLLLNDTSVLTKTLVSISKPRNNSTEDNDTAFKRANEALFDAQTRLKLALTSGHRHLNHIGNATNVGFSASLLRPSHWDRPSCGLLTGITLQGVLIEPFGQPEQIVGTQYGIVIAMQDRVYYKAGERIFLDRWTTQIGFEGSFTHASEDHLAYGFFLRIREHYPLDSNGIPVTRDTSSPMEYKISLGLDHNILYVGVSLSTYFGGKSYHD